MTAKEYVKSIMPKARAERHVEGRIVGKPYWLIRDGRNTMYFAIGKTESNAWVEAKKRLIEQQEKEAQNIYTVQATRISSGERYLVHKGEFKTSKEQAQVECDSCNKLWGDEIKFEVIPFDARINRECVTPDGDHYTLLRTDDFGNRKSFTYQWVEKPEYTITSDHLLSLEEIVTWANKFKS